MRLSLRNLLYEKVKLAEELSSKLGYERSQRARSDYHARKPPVHCGVTVHSVLGCTFRCSYCYLPDMGVSFSHAQPYALSGEEIALALLSNPLFLPGQLGTYVALGSLGEPLHPVGVSRTLEYVDAFARILRNPLQLSTKVAVGDDVSQRLSRVEGAPVNPLVTVIALGSWKKLEPGAPDPYSRLEGIARMRRAGLYPMLFMRPIIPGFEEEQVELLKEAKRYGAAAVVLGGLRVTRSIIARLKSAGVDVRPIMSRVGSQEVGERQKSIRIYDVERALAEEARMIGLTPLYSACCANTLNVLLRTGQRIPCAGLDFVTERFCADCPVKCRSIRVEIDPDEVKWAAAEFLGIKAKAVSERGYNIILHVEDAKAAQRRLRGRRSFKRLLETAYRRALLVEG